MYDIFFSYSRQDQDAVDHVAMALRERGLRVFLDRWYLASGRSWVDELEKTLGECRAVAIFVGPSGIGRWQQREKDLALDRQAADPNFPVIPVLLAGADPALGFLKLNTWVDLRDGSTPTAIDLLAAAARGAPPSESLKGGALASVCPYRGLLRFREEDAPLFFGREAFTDKLIDTVLSRDFVAVVGASGSGKSSVVHAGLVPRLRRGAGTTATRQSVWDIATMQPQERPLYSLAERLVPLLQPEASEIRQLSEAASLADMLSTGQVKLRDIIDRAITRQPGTDCVLLVVDQWEELYTLCHNEAERQQFIDHLLDASSAGNLKVVLTLRGDFFGHALSDRHLSDKLQGGTINIGPMTREELRRAIVGPAERVGLLFEEGLVDRILDDVSDEPGSLPLLEFLLEQLWERRRGNALLHETATAIGGIRRAIADRAESLFTRLTSDEQEAMRWLLLRLVQPSEDGQDIRRRVAFANLDPSARSVAAELTDNRLLVTARGADGTEWVEVAHEALIRGWPRLHQWIDESRDFLRTYSRLEEEAHFWASADRAPDLLIPPGRRLAEAQELTHGYARMLGPSVRDYIDASVAEQRRHENTERESWPDVKAELATAREENARLQRELEAARIRRRSWLVAAAELLVRLLTPRLPNTTEPTPTEVENFGHEDKRPFRHNTPEFWLHRVAEQRKLPAGDEPLVMISYATEDEEWIQYIRAFCDLEELRDSDGRPYEIWNFSDTKRGTGPGDEFPAIVAEKMWRCRAALIILSKDYFLSEYCRRIELPFLLWRYRHHNLPCLFARLGVIPPKRHKIPHYQGESESIELSEIIDDRQAPIDFAKSPYRELTLKQLKEQKIESEIENRFNGIALHLTGKLKELYGAVER